jgi:hypothetical protein
MGIVQKKSTRMWATSEIFNKMPKVNNRQIGEHMPNLVTLKVTYLGFNLIFSALKIKQQCLFNEYHGKVRLKFHFLILIKYQRMH